MAVKFVFLVLPEVHLLDLAGPNQVISESIGYGADFEIEYCSIDARVSSAAGLPFGKLPHYSKIKLKKDDFLIIIGSNTSYLLSESFMEEKELMNRINSLYSAGVNMCSICTGAFVLAQSGLLNGVKCTTHFSLTQKLKELYPLANVTENTLFTEQNGIFTSAGIASGIDLTLYIVEKLKGSYFSHKIARELVVYNRRNGNQNQESELLEYRNHIHAGVHKVQDWLNENLEKKVSLPELAEIANMSDRSLTRIFKKETGATVNEYITVLRKERIKELMKNPDISRAQIAKKCGLKSVRQLIRIMNTIK